MSVALAGRPQVAGEAEGELLFADEPLSFWGGYDPATGEIIDRRHPLAGRAAGGRVLALPATRGSSTTTAVLLEALREGRGPAGLITRGTDAFLALASIVAGELYGRSIPVVGLEPSEYARLAGFGRVRIEASGRVHLIGAAGGEAPAAGAQRR